jgi:hypothetical protein
VPPAIGGGAKQIATSIFGGGAKSQAAPAGQEEAAVDDLDKAPVAVPDGGFDESDDEKDVRIIASQNLISSSTFRRALCL